AAAGKHVVCEKPLCLNLEEADRMIAACQKAGVKLMYAEELCFTPKYVRLKRLVDEGALGRPYLVKQSAKHDGPHPPWFWVRRRRGDGHGLPRLRVLPLAAGQARRRRAEGGGRGGADAEPRDAAGGNCAAEAAAGRVGVRRDGHVRPQGADARRG